MPFGWTAPGGNRWRSLPAGMCLRWQGVGAPARFFAALAAFGLEVEPVRVPDHGRVPLEPLLKRGLPVIMTAKDAVKYRGFEGQDVWWTPAKVVMSEESKGRIVNKVLALTDRSE